MFTSTHNLSLSPLLWKVLYFLLSRVNKLDRDSCIDSFYHLHPPWEATWHCFFSHQSFSACKDGGYREWIRFILDGGKLRKNYSNPTNPASYVGYCIRSCDRVFVSVTQRRICSQPFKAVYCYACSQSLSRQDITSDLRPISLTSCLANVIEGVIHRRLLEQLSSDMDSRQIARHGHSTTHARIYLKQAIHEAVDSGNCSARVFYTDFTKGFRYYRSQYFSERTRLSKNRENITQVVIETCFYHSFIDEIIDIWWW